MSTSVPMCAWAGERRQELLQRCSGTGSPTAGARTSDPGGGDPAALEPLLGSALFQEELQHPLAPEPAEAPSTQGHADAELDQHLGAAQVATRPHMELSAGPWLCCRQPIGALDSRAARSDGARHLRLIGLDNRLPKRRDGSLGAVQCRADLTGHLNHVCRQPTTFVSIDRAVERGCVIWACTCTHPHPTTELMMAGGSLDASTVTVEQPPYTTRSVMCTGRSCPAVA